TCATPGPRGFPPPLGTAGVGNGNPQRRPQQGNWQSHRANDLSIRTRAAGGPKHDRAWKHEASRREARCHGRGCGQARRSGGTIERVEDVVRSDKLVKLTVDFGDHTRSILAGLKKERADPREIEGRQALFVVNLAAKKMAGEVSE